MQPISLNSARGRWLLAATILGSGMAFLDGTVVNVALPAIQSDLAAPLSGLQWILDAYALFLAALLLIGGALGDLYGRKTLFVTGLAFFTAASVGCGLAGNLNVLIAARAVQGIGGALLIPGSLAMIKAVIAPEDSGRAIGWWTGLSSVTAGIGPVVGGYLIHAISWRSIFFLNVPLAAVAIVITVLYIPENRDETASHHLDWGGAAATIVGLGGIIYGLIEGPGVGRLRGDVVSALILGAIALLLFPLRERKARQPMVPLDLFRSRNFTGANLVTLTVYFALYGAILFVVLNLQQVEGYTPLAAGAALAPFTLLLLLLSPWIGGFTNRFGARLLMSLGAVLVAGGFSLFLFTGRGAPYILGVLPSITVLGLGMAIFITPLTATVLSAVPSHAVGIASGVNNAISRVAALLAYAVLGLIVAWRFSTALASGLDRLSLPSAARASLLDRANRLVNDPIPAGLAGSQQLAVHRALQAAFTSAFHWAMATCAVLCLAGALLSVLLIRDEEPAPSATRQLMDGDAEVRSA